MTVIEIEGAAGAAAALGRRRAEQVWVRRLGWFAAVCVAAASLFGVLGFVDIVHGVTAWPAAPLPIALPPPHRAPPGAARPPPAAPPGPVRRSRPAPPAPRRRQPPPAPHQAPA